MAKRNKKYNPRKNPLRNVNDYLTGVVLKRLYMASLDPVSESIKIDTLAPLHTAVLRLNEDGFTDEDFINLNKGMITCWNLAANHCKATKDADTIKAMEIIGKSAEDAAMALHDIGNRVNAKEEVIATEADIRALLRCLDNYEELLNVTTSGLALRAIDTAEKMIDERLSEIDRAAA